MAAAERTFARLQMAAGVTIGNSMLFGERDGVMPLNIVDYRGGRGRYGTSGHRKSAWNVTRQQLLMYSGKSKTGKMWAANDQDNRRNNAQKRNSGTSRQFERKWA